MPQIDLKCVSFDWSDQRWVVYPFRPGLLAIGFWASISTNDSLLATLEPMAPIGVATNQPRSTISETFSPILIISDDSFASIHVNTDLEEHFLKKKCVWLTLFSVILSVRKLVKMLWYETTFKTIWYLLWQEFSRQFWYFWWQFCIDTWQYRSWRTFFEKKYVGLTLFSAILGVTCKRQKYSKSESWIENLRKCYYGTKQLSRQFYISDDSFA